MTTNPTVEQPTPACHYCGKLSGDQPMATYNGCPIHTKCLDEFQQEMAVLDQHREERMPIPDDGYADGGEPYTDEEMDACLQSHYGYGQGRMSP